MNTSKTIRALVVDDSVVIRRLMSIALDKMGLEADYVDNGVSALSSLQNHNYDIVFLDIMMPGMDGYQVCKLIKADKATKDIPVIMLTGKDGAFDKIRGKMAGANHYLTKPVKMSEFKKTVENFLPIPDLVSEAPTEHKASVRPPLTSPAQLKAVHVAPEAKPPKAHLDTQTVKGVKSDLQKEKAKAEKVKTERAKQVDAMAALNKEAEAKAAQAPKPDAEMTREEKIAQIRKMMEK